MAEAGPTAGGALQLDGALQAQWVPRPCPRTRRGGDAGPVGGEEGCS